MGEYIQKGFVLDEVRLKNTPIGTNQTDDYFDLLLEKFVIFMPTNVECICIYAEREIFGLAGDY